MNNPAQPPPPHVSPPYVSTPHVSPPGMWASKLVLRIVQFALAIAIIVCVASMNSIGFWNFGALLAILPQAVVSAVWSFAETISILARGGHRGIHPGANVALDLLLWMGLAGGTIALWLFGVAATLVSSGLTSGLGSSGRGGSRWGAASLGESLSSLQARGQALVGLATTLTVFHFVTFIIACVETNQRNSSSRVIFVTAAPPYSHFEQNVQVLPYSPAPPGQVHYQGVTKA